MRVEDCEWFQEAGYMFYTKNKARFTSKFSKSSSYWERSVQSSNSVLWLLKMTYLYFWPHTIKHLKGNHHNVYKNTAWYILLWTNLQYNVDSHSDMFYQVVLASVTTLKTDQQDLHHLSNVTSSIIVLFLKKCVSSTLKSYYRIICTVTFLYTEFLCRRPPRNIDCSEPVTSCLWWGMVSQTPGPGEVHCD